MPGSDAIKPLIAEFAQRVRAVVEGFEELRSDLQKERDAMTRTWKKREAQLTRMTTGMLSMVGDLQGIGQGALPRIKKVKCLFDHPTTIPCPDRGFACEHTNLAATNNKLGYWEVT